MLATLLKKLIALLTGVVVLGTTGGLPIVPSSMTYVMSYCYPAKDATWVAQSNSAATSSIAQARGVSTVYKDIDGDGTICNSVFKDSNNNEVVVQIPHSQYLHMIQRGGASFNPTKTQFQSVFQALATPVQAAVAFDNSSASGDVTGTSFSWSMTISSTADRYMGCSVAPGNNVNDITSVQYNSVSFTQLDLATPDAFTVSHQYQFGLANPTSGTNNMTVARTASGEIRSICLDYTGAALDNHGMSRLDSGGAFSATTTSSTAWAAVPGCGWQRSPSLGTGITFRSNNGADTSLKAGDSNGIITSPYNMTCTGSTNPGDNSVVWFTVAPPAVVVTPNQDLIGGGSDE